MSTVRWFVAWLMSTHLNCVRSIEFTDANSTKKSDQMETVNIESQHQCSYEQFYQGVHPILADADSNQYIALTCQMKVTTNNLTSKQICFTRADPRFLESGFRCLKGVQFTDIPHFFLNIPMKN